LINFRQIGLAKIRNNKPNIIFFEPLLELINNITQEFIWRKKAYIPDKYFKKPTSVQAAT
jgi:hypothetical protein